MGTLLNWVFSGSLAETTTLMTGDTGTVIKFLFGVALLFVILGIGYRVLSMRKK